MAAQRSYRPGSNALTTLRRVSLRFGGGAGGGGGTRPVAGPNTERDCGGGSVGRANETGAGTAGADAGAAWSRRRLVVASFGGGRGGGGDARRTGGGGECGRMGAGAGGAAPAGRDGSARVLDASTAGSAGMRTVSLRSSDGRAPLLVVDVSELELDESRGRRELDESRGRCCVLDDSRGRLDELLYTPAFGDGPRAW